MYVLRVKVKEETCSYTCYSKVTGVYLYLVASLQIPLQVSDLVPQPLALALQVPHLQHREIYLGLNNLGSGYVT